ncbi:aldose 1-epimerase family protein [Pedobacter sp. SL55]|uniref:aldose 1-epimerase family protein n=1 Tax=Pedobacter sp. SL55 TaxID=2995161 RepID=UPI00226ED68E|nr:aldose 1-epimerase family protein [Pedobacter sp. SL55]WAC42303.1 aldose 1-epimerase family protein [Pedobacter sp. SL55]
MIVSIRNEHLAVEFSTKGAELRSIVGIDSSINYMWHGDAQFWGKFSPVLFPIVGALKENTYEYQGQRYTLPRHGFARDMEFEHEFSGSTAIAFKLKHTEETLKIYPFEFELTLRYRLRGASLQCTYQVVNLGSQTMLFSIGGHPAFAAPLNNEGVYTDYYLQFNNDDELTFNHIEDNLISDETTTIALNDKILPLKHELFYGDALAFKNLKSNHIRLLNTKNYKGLNFHFEGFPCFGVWAAIDADFVCLEPWCGIADGVSHNQQLEEKEGMQRLAAKETWERSWEVSCF